MNPLQKRKFIFVFFLAEFFCTIAHAQNLNEIGVTLLRAVTTNLNGAGIRVAQIEAGQDTNNPPIFWEVNPAVSGHPASLFTYISQDGSSSVYTNSLGQESTHADAVAQNFYGIPNGVATNVAHVDNFEANDFINSVVDPTPYLLSGIGDAVVNQSFTFGPLSTNDQQTVDSAYDNYSDQFQTLFISAACNASISPRVCAPGTAYNCISVGAYHGDSSVGPTFDGRCKPDITAPAGVTSFSTPQVAGAAAILIQAALRGDGGDDTNSAADLRTVKALLLNGAVKPADWTNSNFSPLDFRYGAGVVNVFNSYEQLAGGKSSFNFSTNISSGNAHLPVALTNSISNLHGWDFNTNTSDATDDGVNHYFFNVNNDSALAGFAATITLVWNRSQSISPDIHSDINHLALFLYNCANSNLVMCSTSVVDNVQHIFLPRLAPGRYDLQVWKAGGLGIAGDSETYALAWTFSSTQLAISKVETNLNLSWPVYPTGFAVESTTNLSSPQVWRTNGIPLPAITNNQNAVSIPTTNAVRFFRLRTPNF